MKRYSKKDKEILRKKTKRQKIKSKVKKGRRVKSKVKGRRVKSSKVKKGRRVKSRKNKRTRKVGGAPGDAKPYDDTFDGITPLQTAPFDRGVQRPVDDALMAYELFLGVGHPGYHGPYKATPQELKDLKTKMIPLGDKMVGENTLDLLPPLAAARQRPADHVAPQKKRKRKRNRNDEQDIRLLDPLPEIDEYEHGLQDYTKFVPRDYQFSGRYRKRPHTDDLPHAPEPKFLTAITKTGEEYIVNEGDLELQDLDDELELHLERSSSMSQ